MKKRLFGISIILLGLLVNAVAGCQSQFQPGTYTDDIGREVNIDVAPQRIVSHVPPITEILFALGLGDKVVGVSDYCDYPEEATSKPSVGNYFEPSIERIVDLNPDLVLTDGHSESVKQLDSLGITMIVIDPADIEGIYRDIELLGKVTGVEAEAEKLIKDMKDDISNVVELVKDAPKIRTFYIIDGTDLSNPWTAGPGSFVDSLISMAGGENIAGEAQGAWVQFSIEQVVSSDPEVIIIPAAHGSAIISPEVLKENAAWREISAVKNDKISIIDGDLVDGFGPRIVQGLEEIARIIHPELFD